MENKMCHPSLTDLNYILQRWESKWSAQRDAAWRLRSSQMRANDQSDSQPQPDGTSEVPLPSCNEQMPAPRVGAMGVQMPAGALAVLQPVLDAKLCGFPLEDTVAKELYTRGGPVQNAKDAFAKRASNCETSSKEVTP
jgi:hypothetical protein